MKYKVIGDVHDNRATVLIEENGERRIRKPGSAAVELAYKAFLSRLGEEGFLYIPGTVQVLSSNEKEYETAVVGQTPAVSPDEISMYYKRSGAMLFFAYLFSSKDLHDENMIAAGSFPTIIDYETLMSAPVNRGDFATERGIAASVLGTHLLSQWMRGNGNDVEYGGLTGENGKQNVLFFQGKPAHSYEHTVEICEGFRYAYDFVTERCDLIRELLHMFDTCSFRIILRPSYVYDVIGSRTETLEEEQREQYVKMLLERAYTRDIDPKRITEAQVSIAYETESVLNGEIPLFFVKGDGKDLRNRKGIVWSGFLKLSPVANAEKRLESLSVADRNSQLRIIEQALLAVKPVGKESEELVIRQVTDHMRKVFVTNESAGDTLRKAAVRSSRKLLEQIEQNSIKTLESGWLRLGRSDYGRLCLQSCGLGLYDGLMGILCAYAAVYRNSGDSRILENILSRYENYRSAVLPSAGCLDGFKAGLQEGIGGHLLALKHLYELTEIDLFREDGQKMLETVRIESGKPQDWYDVLGGYAGLALALPYFETPAAGNIAEELGRKLASADVSLTGTAHGAAGIALALGAIGHVLDSNRYDSRISEILKWENTYYNEEKHNWADLRSPERKGFMFGWCSGAPGIGIARKKLWGYTEDEEIRRICLRDIGRVKEALKTREILPRDGLCCGNSARLAAASALGISTDDVCLELVRRVSEDRIRLVHPAATCDLNSGLMQGLSGICYALAMYGDEMSGGMLY